MRDRGSDGGRLVRAWRGLGALAALGWLILAAACGGGPLVRVMEPDGRGLTGAEAMLGGARQGEDEGGLALRGAERYGVEEYRRLFGDVETSDYRLGSGDSLTVTVFDEPTLSLNAARPDADGCVNMPLIGRVAVVGRTAREVEETVTQGLKAGRFMKNPQVTVSVAAYESRMVHVLGAVNKPGLYPLRGGETVLDMVAKAGGIYFGQAGNQVTVLREKRDGPTAAKEGRTSAGQTADRGSAEQAPGQAAGQASAGQSGAGQAGAPADAAGNRLDGRASGGRVAIEMGLHDLLYANTLACNIPVTTGDAVFIHWPEKIYVMGEVNRPGEYILKARRVSLVEALGMAGGFTRLADQNAVRVIRVEDGRQKIIEVRVKDMMEKGLRFQDVTLQPGDIVMAPESFF